MIKKRPVKYKQKKSHAEEIVQRHCADFLYKVEAYTKQIMFNHPANELLRDTFKRVFFTALGLRVGLSDLEIWIRGGKTIFIEIKVGTQKQSENQKTFEKGINDLGFDYYIVRAENGADAIKQIWDILQSHGVKGMTVF